MPGSLEQLVMDTLLDRRQPKQHSCLVVNEAGMELLAGTRDALPVIERVLREVVLPTAAAASTWPSRFPGLDYVFGAYMVIGRKVDDDRIFSFVRSLPQTLFEEALHAVPVFFRRMKEGYNSGVPPGEPMKKFLTELSLSPEAMVRDTARQVLERVQFQP